MQLAERGQWDKTFRKWILKGFILWPERFPAFPSPWQWYKLFLELSGEDKDAVLMIVTLTGSYTCYKPICSLHLPGRCCSHFTDEETEAWGDKSVLPLYYFKRWTVVLRGPMEFQGLAGTHPLLSSSSSLCSLCVSLCLLSLSLYVCTCLSLPVPPMRPYSSLYEYLRRFCAHRQGMDTTCVFYSWLPSLLVRTCPLPAIKDLSALF